MVTHSDTFQIVYYIAYFLDEQKKHQKRMYCLNNIQGIFFFTKRKEK